MITKIQRIKQFAVFKDFQWDLCAQDENAKPIEFKKLNIIYGRNYSGKTTISRIMRALETRKIPEKYDNPEFSLLCSDATTINQSTLANHTLDVRVFNEDFVRCNLRFLSDADQEIAPFAILGSNNANIENKIKVLTTELGSTIEGRESGLYEKKKSKKEVLHQAQGSHAKAESDLENRLSDKAINRETGIKYRVDKFGDQNYSTSKLKKDIASVSLQTYVQLGNSEIQEYERILHEQEKALVTFKSELTLSFDSLLLNSKELLTRQIGTSNKIKELLHNSALNEWVRKGAELHSERKICTFCNNSISDERWKEINDHFDEESKKLGQDIDKYIHLMEEEQRTIQSEQTIDKALFYSTFHAQLDLLRTKISLESQKYNNQIDKLKEQLNARKQQITMIFKLDEPEDHQKALHELFKEYQNICKSQNQYTEKLEQEQKSAKEKLRLHEVFVFCSTIEYSSTLTQIDKLKTNKEDAEKEYDDTEKLIKTKESKIESLRRQLNDEEAGAQKVNQYLTDYFGHDFLSLQAIKEENENPKIRFEIVRNGVKAFNLSEGECRLIAFCYFMAKLDDVETKGKKPIIWIDDPISSLDGNHVFFIYSLLRAELVEQDKFEQLFISTHNLDFLKYLKRLQAKRPENMKKENNRQFFIIQRQDKMSTIKKMPNYLEKNVTEFNYLFHEIYKCSKIEMVNDENYTTFYNFGNNARKFLEMLMFYCFPDNRKEFEKLEKFFGEGKVPAILTDRINNEYSHLSGAFERGAAPMEVPEMLKTAKLIITTLSNTNPDQYAALKSSIKEESGL